MFPPGFTCPAVLWIQLADSAFRLQDSHLLWFAFPHNSAKLRRYRNAVHTPKIFLLSVWPPPRSLATTCGISVDFFSSPYLDVSVQAVPYVYLWIQYTLTGLHQPGCPIRKSSDITLAYSSPRLIAVNHVLHRLPVPRHSPCALCSLTSFLIRRLSLRNLYCLPRHSIRFFAEAFWARLG